MLSLGNKLSISSIKTARAAGLAGYGTLDLHYDLSSSKYSSDGSDDPIATLYNEGGLGSSYNAAQADTLKQARIRLAHADNMAKKSLFFDNTNDHYTLNTTYVTNQAFTMAVAIRLSDLDGDAALSGDTAGLNRFHIISLNALQFRFNGDGGYSNSNISVSLNTTDGGTTSYQLSDAVEILVIRKDGDDNLHIYNKNGDKIAYTAASTDTDLGLEIGTIGIQLTSGQPFGGLIGEMGVYSADIGDAKAQEAAQFLYAKWS